MIGSNITQRGFALFIAVILSSVAAVVTLALTSLAYKSLILSSTARESQYAFYAADTALECALYWDAGKNNASGVTLFPYDASATTVTITCGTQSVTLTGSQPDVHTTKYQSGWFALNGSACARVSVYKTDGTTAPAVHVGQLFGDGVNVACAKVTTNPIDPRAIERGLKAWY